MQQEKSYSWALAQRNSARWRKIMAKQKTQATEEPQVTLGHAKVKRLIIKNFRCIGPAPVEIDLDEIVVLVGANNAGKSTILRAYEVVMCHGSAEGKLSIADFPKEIVNPNQLPEIELQTYVDPDASDKPGEQWLHFEQETDRHYVRERWIWDSPNKEPDRQGRRANAEDWSNQVPWGAPNVAKAQRPVPHRVDAFASPEEQARGVISIIKAVLLESAKKPGEGDDTATALEKLKIQILNVQADLIQKSTVEIAKIEEELSEIISEVFKGFKVKIDPRHQDISDKALNLFSNDPILRMGPEDGHAAPIERQGSGARRTLLWAALKLVGEKSAKQNKSGSKSKGKTNIDIDANAENFEPSRPHVLLMDEPEICLHPNAIREACRVLYELSSNGSGWQVMLTTHSPAFIDLSRDNTTIVRVERDEQGGIHGTTVFRPALAKLDDDDKKMLKLLNTWDPYVGEFFFGGHSVIVEGDTEYSAFQLVIEREREVFSDIHIIRARGKFIIPSLMKILNHFGSGYAVLHDSDRPLLESGGKNPAWSGNESILAGMNAAPLLGNVRLLASVPNFEEAFLQTLGKQEKPYQAVFQMQSNEVSYSVVRSLLLSLVNNAYTPPDGATEWKSIQELAAIVDTKMH
jgi:putative ATP-dependent endonuclease of OLD family